MQKLLRGNRFAAIIMASALTSFALTAGPRGEACASMRVVPAIMTFEDGKKDRKDFKVSNTSQRTQYLDITAFRITEPGASPEDLQTNPDPEEVGLLVAPRKIILRPGETKLIRTILLEQNIENDQAWRVSIKPVIGDVTAKSNGTLISIAFNALVIGRPTAPNPDVKGHWEDHTLVLHNYGNSYSKVIEGQQCVPGIACKNVKPKRIWPGESHHIEFPHKGHVKIKFENSEQLLSY